ncbi:hypothetical protein BGZ54_002622 [Gamsiella multidivaricata]|nr:hypothetical protein BGZ54_002622 [Gamsiella multidivaricata]
MLLLHGTEDPICSYQATATLSTQLLKLRPTNFVFKSWKGNKHDPHWDIDANSIKSEYVHWIRNTVRHFDKVPLNPNMVHSDCIKSARSRAAFKNDKSDKSQKERTKADKKKKEHEQHIQATVNLTTDASSMEATKAVGVKENPAESHPEQIQGLEDLRRQQQQRLERLEAKRREYVEGDEKVKRKAAGQSTVPEADQHKPAEELKASEAIMPIVPETIQPSAPETIQSNAPEAIQSEATNANEIEAFSMGSPASAAGDQAQVEETEFKAAEGPVDGATANTIAAVAVEIAMQEGEASNEDQAEEPTQDNNANVLDLPEAALENTNHEIEFSSAVEPTPPQATPTAVLSEPTQHGDGKEADQEGHDAGREICNVLPAANEQMTIAAPDEIAAESIIAVEPCEAVAEAAEPIKEALSVPDALPETEVADDGTRSRLEHAE